MQASVETEAGASAPQSSEGTKKPSSRLSGGMIALIFLAVLVILIAANM